MTGESTTKVQFNPGSWAEFYESYIPGLRSLVASESGWVNFPCVLPCHPERTKSEMKGGLHLPSGLYKCWSGSCQELYFVKFYGTKPQDDVSPILSPQQFLEIVDPNLDVDFAREAAERFRLRDGIESHFDGKESSTPVSSFELEKFAADAAARLRPDLQEVLEYHRTRGITYETLAEMHVGFVPELNSQTACLIFPYTYRGRVVGLKARALDGRKGGMANSYITLFGFDQLITSTSTTCIIVEGETDTLYMRQILDKYDLNQVVVVGTSGITFKREWVRDFAAMKRVIAVPQADEASRRWIRTVQKAFSLSADREDPRLIVVDLPWPRGVFGKDICDFCRYVPEGAQRLIDCLGVSSIDVEVSPYVLSKDELLLLATKSVPTLVPRVLNRRAKMLIVGPPKTYKTWLALYLSRALIDGRHWIDGGPWLPNGGHKVLYVLEEGSSASIGKRLEVIGIEGPDISFIHRQIVQLDEVGSFQRLHEAALKLKPDLLVLDPLASLHTGDENSAHDMMEVMKQLDRLLYTLPEMSLVIIHHTPKHSRGARGSGAIWANADVMIELSVPDERAPSRLDMRISGRDFDDPDHSMSSLFFDPLSCRFTWSSYEAGIKMSSASAGPTPDTLRTRVLDLGQDRRWMNVYSLINISDDLPLTQYETVRAVMTDMVRRGELEIAVASTLDPLVRPAGGGPRSHVFRTINS